MTTSTGDVYSGSFKDNLLDVFNKQQFFDETNNEIKIHQGFWENYIRKWKKLRRRG